MQLLVRLNCLFQLLFAHIAPGTDRVANDIDVELCHSAQRGSKHSRNNVGSRADRTVAVIETLHSGGCRI